MHFHLISSRPMRVAAKSCAERIAALLALVSRPHLAPAAGRVTTLSPAALAKDRLRAFAKCTPYIYAEWIHAASLLWSWIRLAIAAIARSVAIVHANRYGRWLIRITVAALCVLFVNLELSTSFLQSHLLSLWACGLKYKVAEGTTDRIRFPLVGPYNDRLGYIALPGILSHLEETQGAKVTGQAQWSALLERQVKAGFFPTYHEKPQAGLQIIGQRGGGLYDARYPKRVYGRFEEIPPVVYQALLFIENKELMDDTYATRNPAVQWDRLVLGFGRLALSKVGIGGRAPGASTLATQLVKMRHSPQGRTSSLREKAKQMVTASIRAYLDGPNTSQSRKTIVTDYINAIPLGALPGYGEVIGLGDGLWGFFGVNFAEINRLLRDQGGLKSVDLAARGKALREVLGLLVGLRRPGYYLFQNQKALDALVNSYARMMAGAGIISPALLVAVLARNLDFATPTALASTEQSGETDPAAKAVSGIRAELQQKIGIPNSYQFDRLDLVVRSALDHDAQKAVSELLHRLVITKDAKDGGIALSKPGESLGAAPHVFYSFTLYERLPQSNALRVQVDNYNQKLNLNEGMRLELGSTAKLRTLISYLDTITDIYESMTLPNAQEIRDIDLVEDDALSLWVKDYILDPKNAGHDLNAILAAAMERVYAASPWEGFLTGGGLHHFHNYNEEDNSRQMTVREAFAHSVNLPFVRIMRDVVNHQIALAEPQAASIIRDPAHPERAAYIDRFSAFESRVFLGKFYKKYAGMDIKQALDKLLASRGITPRSATIVYMTVHPHASYEEFLDFMAGSPLRSRLNPQMIVDLYAKYQLMDYSWADLGFLTRMHPLELWYLTYLKGHEGARMDEAWAASEKPRAAIYDWLKKPSRKHQQDIRIRQMMERDAFAHILKDWQRVGYPFSNMVPSYATALGSSGDRPAALAYLIGSIVRGGVAYPQTKYSDLRFGPRSPYETVVTLDPGTPRRIIREEVSAVAKSALRSVVDSGTAIRIRETFADASGGPLEVGGKTGTGDNRLTSVGARGGVIQQRVVNRTATFAFYLGERWFGVVTAYAPGREAEGYVFTSALPVSILARL